MAVLWIVLAFVVAAVVGWPVTSGVLRVARSAEKHQKTPVGVLRGGLVIGILERAAVVLCILAGQPMAIAYVVAIKGLGRYPELKSTPAASERFIIGTLSSLLWAAAVAAFARTVLLN